MVKQVLLRVAEDLCSWFKSIDDQKLSVDLLLYFWPSAVCCPIFVCAARKKNISQVERRGHGVALALF